MNKGNSNYPVIHPGFYWEKTCLQARVYLESKFT